MTKKMREATVKLTRVRSSLSRRYFQSRGRGLNLGLFRALETCNSLALSLAVRLIKPRIRKLRRKIATYKIKKLLKRPGTSNFKPMEASLVR